MRALIINPYRYEVTETDIPPSLEGIQSAVHGSIEFVHQFPNGDILYVNGNGQGRFDARFGLGGGNTAPGYGVIVGSVGLENARRRRSVRSANCASWSGSPSRITRIDQP